MIKRADHIIDLGPGGGINGGTTGAPLTAKEKTIHEQGLVSVLMQLHDELDAAVARHRRRTGA